VVATPGRLVDMFARKQTTFDLSASIKALVGYNNNNNNDNNK